MFQNNTLQLIIWGFLLGMVSVGCSSDEPTIGNGASAQEVMRADYVVVRPQALANELSITGTLMPGESAMLSAQTSGQVKSIHFQEGQLISKGKLLVKLDDRQWQAQRKKLQAQLATAKKDLERKKKLSEIQGVSQAEIDDADLKVATIQADINELDVMIDYASIRAPFSGQIGLRMVSPGSYLSAGEAVARLVQLNPLRLEFSVPERYAGQVEKGQAVRFTLSGSDSTYAARVYATEPAIRETTRALRIRARVDNRQRKLIAGAFAEVSLSLDSLSNALLVPTESLIPRLNEQIVYQIKGGKMQEVKVKTGLRLPRLVQVQEGLQVGDTIMVSGLLQASDGKAVAPGNELKVEMQEN
jgi:membrane fusion protein (multidrug efflux system)